jgi:putative membrane protein
MIINPAQLVATLIYSVVGIVIFILAYRLAEKLLPFNLDKELAEDQNTAVGVLMGSVMIGLAIIIASAIHG